MTKLTYSLAVFFLMSLLCAATQAAPRFADPATDLSQLFALVDERLALMDDVAAYKWQHNSPITDSVREQQLIDSMIVQAAQLGLFAAPTRKFFRLQIDWGVAIQSQRFAEWQQMGKPQGQPIDAKQRNLTGEIRPRLDAIGHEQLKLIYLLAAELPSLSQSNATVAIESAQRDFKAVQKNRRDRVTSLLKAFNVPAAGRLESIRASGVLRIATTGDYFPFSGQRGDQLVGFDVDLTEALAAYLQVKPRYVRTTWPTLMNDLSAGRFDLAASGISVTLARAELGLFSRSYHQDGKMPITRCENAARFASLEQIDQSDVRIIVNPGGTNEQFVRANIKAAEIRVHADNTSIFDEIIQGRADVMITDNAEVIYQQQLHPQLCGAATQTFTQSEKAVLMPRTANVRSTVNEWLSLWMQQHSLQSWKGQ